VYEVQCISSVYLIDDGAMNLQASPSYKLYKETNQEIGTFIES